MHERPIRQLSIDRSSSAARSISISNPSINMLETSGNGRSPLVQAEVVLRAFSFGPFRIVPHARLVERDGSPMPLGSRAFDLLCVLVSRPGEVVSKGELMAKVWPELTAEESSLRFHIARLRCALGDGQGGERDVTTVTGRGYCFVAAVGRGASPYTQHSYA
jgi:DNA-binding winged helix-turn-helix (wHTH) protein